MAFGIFVALAALTLQIQSNNLSKESIEVARKGNTAAEKSYRLQLWEDCQDKHVIAPLSGGDFREKLTQSGLAGLASMPQYSISAILERFYRPSGSR